MTSMFRACCSVRLLWYPAQSLLNEFLIKIGALKRCSDKNDHQGNGDRVRYTFGKRHARDSFLGNADGVDGTIHARVDVAS